MIQHILNLEGFRVEVEKTSRKVKKNDIMAHRVNTDAVSSGPVGSTACESSFCWVLPDAAGAGIEDLFLSSAGDVWAAASSAFALRLEAGGWVGYAVPGEPRLKRLWEQGGSLYAMGRRGLWARFDGARWQAMSPQAPVIDVRAACSIGGTKAWAVDAAGLGSYALNAVGWTAEAVDVRDLLCLGTDAWRLTDTGVERYDGAAWNQVFPIQFGNLLRGTGPDDLWVAASTGIVHWDGSGTSTHADAGFIINDFDVSGGEQWAVGNNLRASMWNGVGWESVLSNGAAPQALTAVFIVAANDVWMGGDAGVLSHWDGTDASILNQRSLRSYADGWASSNDDIWLIGSNSDGSALSLHWNGVEWEDIANPAVAALESIWGFATDDIWASSGPELIHWDGVSWSLVDLGETVSITDLWGPSPTDLWMIEGGVVARWDGTQWHRVGIPTGARSYSIGGPHSGLLVAVGIYGSLARFDGSTWTALNEPNDEIHWNEVVPAGTGVLVLGPGAVLWID